MNEDTTKATLGVAQITFLMPNICILNQLTALRALLTVKQSLRNLDIIYDIFLSV